MSKSATIVAEVIEPTALVLVITKMQPGATIEANFEELERGVEEKIAIYRDVVVSADGVAEAKKYRASLNAFRKDIDQVRLRVTREYTAPAVEFGDHVKSLTARIDEVALAIDVQVKAFEAQEKIAKRIELVKHYTDYAGALVEVVPFERIEDAAWLNKTVNLMAAFEAIEKTIDRIARDDATLEGMGLAYLTDAKTTYFETLDLGAAIARSKALEEAAERTRRLDAEKAEIAAYRAEQESKAAPPLTYDESRAMLDEVERAKAEEITEGIAELVAEVSTFTFSVVCTDAQRAAIIGNLRGMGLTGTVRKEA